MSTDYPKATLQAQQLAGLLKSNLNQLSPATELATIVDITYQLTQGYVTATSRRGPITVIGCPIGAVCSGMDIFVRKFSNTGINQYVYDGPVPPTLVGNTSGAILLSNTSSDGTTYGGHTGTWSTNPGLWDLGIGVTAPPSNSDTQKWFWSFFFYMPTLPQPGLPVGLATTHRIHYDSGAGFYLTDEWVSIGYNYLGQIGLAFTYTPGGTPTRSISFCSQSFAPGKVWFLQLHLGNGLAMNGQTGSGLTLSNLNSLPVPLQTSLNHTFLDGGEQLAPPPIGTWISKFVFGHYPPDAYGSYTFPYPVGGFVPTNNSQIINQSATFNTGLRVYDRLLISDRSGLTLPNTGASGVAGTVPDATFLINAGPY